MDKQKESNEQNRNIGSENKDTTKREENRGGHLTSDLHIRFRGHPSEMQPHHGNLETNMESNDIHDKKKEK